MNDQRDRADRIRSRRTRSPRTSTQGRPPRCSRRCCGSDGSRNAASSCTRPAKIRGFLHLYIGEEAVATGVMGQAAARRRRRGHLPRPRPRPRARACRCVRSWRRCSAGSRAAAADAAARCTSSMPTPASTAATPSSAAGCPVAAGLALAEHLGGRDGVTRLLLRRRRRRRGRVPRDDEPGRPVEAAGAVLLREQPLRHGHGARAGPRPRPTSPVQGSGLRDAGLVGRRHGRVEVVAEAADRALTAVRPGAGRSSWRLQHLPVPGPLDVRPRALPGADEVEHWKERDPLVTFSDRGSRADLVDARSATAWRPRPSQTEVDDAVAFAEAAELEPSRSCPLGLLRRLDDGEAAVTADRTADAHPGS